MLINLDLREGKGCGEERGREREVGDQRVGRRERSERVMSEGGGREE